MVTMKTTHTSTFSTAVRSALQPLDAAVTHEGTTRWLSTATRLISIFHISATAYCLYLGGPFLFGAAFGIVMLLVLGVIKVSYRREQRTSS